MRMALRRIVLTFAMALAATVARAAPPPPAPELAVAPAPALPAPASPGAATVNSNPAAPVAPSGLVLSPAPAAISALTARTEFLAELPNVLTGEAELKIIPRSDASQAQADWSLIKTGTGVSTGAPHTVDLDGGALELRLILRDLGIGATYAADVVLTAKGKPGRIWPVRIRRGSGPLASDALVAPGAPVQLDNGSGELVLPLRNLTASPVVVSRPSLVEIVRQADGQSSLSSLAPTSPRITCTGKPQANATELAAGERCQARLTVAAVEPGIYSAKIAVTDIEGRASEAVATLQVRRPACVALMLSFFGTLIGIGLKVWSSSGRPRLASLRQLGAAWESWRLIHQSADTLGLGAVSRPTGQRLGRLRGGLGEIDPAEVAALATRVERLDAWIQTEEQARQVKDPTSLQAMATPLRAALSVLGDTSALVAGDPEIVQALAAYAKAVASSIQGQAEGAETAAEVRTPASMALRVASSRSLKALIDLGDFVAAGLGLILIQLSTLELVWLPDPTWGGWRDIVALFIGSIAAQAGAMTAVDGFRGRVRGIAS